MRAISSEKNKGETNDSGQVKREHCVICHCLTDVPVDMSVSLRPWYVPGAGQLCADCCKNIYHVNDYRSLTGDYGDGVETQ